MNDWYSAGEVEKVLGITNYSRQKLQKEGFLQPKPGKPLRFSKSAIDQLVDAPAPQDRALIMRMGVPSIVGDRKTGWSENYTPEEQRESVRKWWPVASPEENWVGATLVASVGDWAVAAWPIVGAWKNPEGGAVAFEIMEDLETRNRWRNKRLYLPQGLVGPVHWPRSE